MLFATEENKSVSLAVISERKKKKKECQIGSLRNENFFFFLASLYLGNRNLYFAKYFEKTMFTRRGYGRYSLDKKDLQSFVLS